MTSTRVYRMKEKLFFTLFVLILAVVFTVWGWRQGAVSVDENETGGQLVHTDPGGSILFTAVENGVPNSYTLRGV